MNYELKVKDISLETYLLIGEINDQNIISKLIDDVEKNKDENLSYKTHVKGHFTGFESLILNNNFHDFLKLIQPYIYAVYNKNFIIKNAWGNIITKGEEVTEHNHRDVSAFCGILYLTEGGPGTYFKEYDLTIEEKIGRYVLFHPMLSHSVKKIEDNIKRITIAFNMANISPWDEQSKITYVNKK
jgi:hypothetical protein